MALQITTNINVDFYDNKYVMINAKQYDDKSRLVSVTCYNQGSLYNLSNRNHTAYIKYRKADGRWVLNCCTINNKGQILIELTEQMLAASGICYVDLFIVNKGSAIVNIDTGSIVTIDGSSVLTTRAFYIDVQEAVVDNSLIESSDEYNGLTDLISMAEAEYNEVIQAAKSYAIGTDNYARENDEKDNSKYYSQVSKSYAMGNTGVRSGENADNSKYYSQLAKNSADSADESEANAKSYMDSSEEYMNTTNGHMQTTKSYMDTTESHMNATDGYMKTTESYMNNTNGYMGNAKTYMNNALASEQNAKASETSAQVAQTAAETAQQKSETAQTAAETAQQNAEQAQSAAEAAQSASEAAQRNAESAQQNAEKAASTAAQDSVDNVLSLMNEHVTASQESATNALNSEQAAKTSETNAKASEQAAATSETNAKASEDNAKLSEQVAATSATNASYSEVNALNNANASKSYAIGGTGTRENEDIDNAKYYYELAKSIVDDLNNKIATIDEVASYLGI